MITNRPATVADIMALQLRPEDAAEASPDWRAHAISCMNHGDVVQAFLLGDTVVALVGMTQGPMFAAPWLLCSPLVEGHKTFLWRRALRLVEVIRESKGFATIGNFIGKHSTSNRRFIQALGFVILVSPSGDHDFFYLPHV